MIYYKIIPDKRLIIEYFEGILTLDEILKFVRCIKMDKNFDTSFNSLIDLSDMEMEVSAKEVEKYVNYLKKNKSLMGNRKLAMITKTPEHVVIATLYKLLGKDLPLNIKVFSTFEAAIRWLGVFRFNYDDYSKIINGF